MTRGWRATETLPVTPEAITLGTTKGAGKRKKVKVRAPHFSLEMGVEDSRNRTGRTSLLQVTREKMSLL